MINAPQSLEGFQTWDIIQRASTQFRFAPNGRVIGFELGILFQLADALGYCKHTFAELAPAAQAGLLLSIREMQNGES